MKDQAQQYLEEDDCCAGAPVMEEELPRDTPDQLKKKQAVTKEALLRSSYPVHTKCTKCKDALRHFSVFCKTCKGQLCSYCDLITHYLEPLHERRLLLETTFEEVKVFDVHSLLPTTFVDSWGETFSIGNTRTVVSLVPYSSIVPRTLTFYICRSSCAMSTSHRVPNLFGRRCTFAMRRKEET